MQIVIDIPDEWEKDTSIPTKGELVELIVNGTPLIIETDKAESEETE